MKADGVYLKLLKDIMDNGAEKTDRTGTGTISVFGRMIRFNMADGFPLLTTKKMFTKGITTELLWFLTGETNIKPLVDQGNMIWVGDAYKKYEQYHNNHPTIHSNRFDILSKEEFIEKIKTDETFANKWGELGPVYGKQWTDWGGYEINSGEEIEGLNKGVNQIQKVIDMLNENPDSRRIMVNAWNVTDLDKMTLPPCHYGFQLNTQEMTDDDVVKYYYKHITPDVEYKYDEQRGSYYCYDLKDNIWWEHSSSDILLGMRPDCPKYKLSLMWNQRSVDAPLGLPFNIASYGILLHIISKLTNMVPNELIGSLGDVHIYQNQVDGVKTQILREPKKLPILKISDNVNFNNGLEGFIKSCTYKDFTFSDYDPHPVINFPLSN